METVVTERVKTIKLKPFHHTLRLVVSSDVQQSFDNRRGRMNTRLPTPRGYAFTFTDKRSFDIYVFLPELCGLGATAHEMFHVITFMMSEAGAEFEEESWAYWIQYLTQEAAEFVHLPPPVKRKSKKGTNAKRTNA